MAYEHSSNGRVGSASDAHETKGSEAKREDQLSDAFEDDTKTDPDTLKPL